MILTIEEARETLRVDGEDNDNIISGLLLAIPGYITTCTGVTDPEALAETVPLIKTSAKFILALWYNPDGTDSARLQVVIDNLLKTLKSISRDLNK